MTLLNYKYIIIYILFLFLPTLSFAQSSETLINTLKNSQDWRERHRAAISLNQLPHNLKTEDIQEALVKELFHEHKRAKEKKMEYCNEPCEYDESIYYMWLQEIVSDMVDERAFTLFKEFGNTMALSKYGDKGMDALLEYLETSACGSASPSLHYLENALKQKDQGYVAKNTTRDKIKNALIKALTKYKHPPRDTEWFEIREVECGHARKSIVRALGYLAESGDSDVIPTLKLLANKDPYVKKMGDVKRYPIREEAQKILDNLSDK